MSTIRDLRQGLRTLLRRPGFSVAVVLTVGLAVGAQSAVFGLVDRVLLRALPFPDSDRLVGVWFSVPGPLPRTRHSEGTFTFFREDNEVFEEVAVTRRRPMTIEWDGIAEQVEAALITPSLFGVLQVAPHLGRPMQEVHQDPGGEPVVALSHGFWTRRYGADPEVIGEALRVDGVTRRIVAVLPPGTSYPAAETQLWVPMTIDPADPDLNLFFYEGVGRLRPDATIATATADVDRLIQRLPEVYPNFFSRELLETGQIHGLVIPLQEQIVGDVGTILWILFAGVGVVLLVAIANLVNLFLVRVESRFVELAVRRAVGADDAQVRRHLLAETLVLTALGGVVGLGIASLALVSLRGLGSSVLPRAETLGLDWSLLAFTTAITFAVGISVGLVGARRARNRATLGILRGSGRRLGLPIRDRRMRGTLIATQVALAVTLLVGAGLLSKSLATLSEVDTGFDATDVLAVRYALPASTYSDWERVTGFHRQVLTQVRDVPGVVSASLTTFLPLRDGRVFQGWLPAEYEVQPEEIPESTLTKAVADDYFETLGVPRIEGRTFDAVDWTQRDRPRIAIVNEAYARDRWPNASAVGQRIHRGDPAETAEVIGVVGAVRDRSLSDPGPPMVYIPFDTTTLRGGVDIRAVSLAVHSDRGEALAGVLRGVVQEIDPSVPVFSIEMLEATVSNANARLRFATVLLLFSAGGALLLGAVGLYGVLAYSVSQRRSEIGLRMALGARPGAVLRMVVTGAARLTLAGTGIGLALALLSTRWLESVLFQVDPSDPVVILAVVSVLWTVCLLAAWIPARRAAGLDVVDALAAD